MSCRWLSVSQSQLLLIKVLGLTQELDNDPRRHPAPHISPVRRCLTFKTGAHSFLLQAIDLGGKAKNVSRKVAKYDFLLHFLFLGCQSSDPG